MLLADPLLLDPLLLTPCCPADPLLLPITRETIIQAADSYETVEEYPEDKYLPSYLLLGRLGEETFHVLFAADLEGQNVRIVTAYYPSAEEWEADLKTRRRSL